MSRKILKGKVISDKNKKTIVVLVERKYQHPFLPADNANHPGCSDRQQYAQPRTAVSCEFSDHVFGRTIQPTRWSPHRVRTCTGHKPGCHRCPYPH